MKSRSFLLAIAGITLFAAASIVFSLNATTEAETPTSGRPDDQADAAAPRDGAVPNEALVPEGVSGQKDDIDRVEPPDASATDVPAAEAEPDGCDGNIDCPTDLTCQNHQCQVPQPAGGLCADDRGCQAGRFCQNGRCGPEQPAGGACINPPPPPGGLFGNGCQGDLTCQNGRCQPEQEVGSDCENDLGCRRGLMCGDGICIPRPPVEAFLTVHNCCPLSGQGHDNQPADGPNCRPAEKATVFIFNLDDLTKCVDIQEKNRGRYSRLKPDGNWLLAHCQPDSQSAATDDGGHLHAAVPAGAYMFIVRDQADGSLLGQRFVYATVPGEIRIMDIAYCDSCDPDCSDILDRYG